MEQIALRISNIAYDASLDKETIYFIKVIFEARSNKK